VITSPARNQSLAAIDTAVASATGIDFRPKSATARAWVKADAILDKPVRFEQLTREISRLLKLPH